MCYGTVNPEHCISTHYSEPVPATDEVLSFCIDYCFKDDTPAIVTPPPSVTLEPTPMPTTWMPTALPTPPPTQIYTQPCVTCPSPVPTPLPTWSPTPKPTFVPTLYP